MKWTWRLLKKVRESMVSYVSGSISYTLNVGFASAAGCEHMVRAFTKVLLTSWGQGRGDVRNTVSSCGVLVAEV